MDLSCTYMGLPLRNPLVASASPLSYTLEGIRRLADAGVGAIVMYSLFEEELRAQALRDSELVDLNLIERAAASVDVPVIASLNGASPDGWSGYAHAMQEAGAAALELNAYYLPDAHTSAREVEQRQLEVLERVKGAVSLPVAVKLSPHFSSTGEIARQLDEAGADALVLFNRFLQPDIDQEALSVVPSVTLSSPAEARLPRTWIALLRGRVNAALAASTGVEDAGDLAKYLLAGADVVMSASALIRHGPEHAGALLDGLSAWMSSKGFAALAELRGILSVPVGSEEHYERMGYVNALRAANAGV